MESLAEDTLVMTMNLADDESLWNLVNQSQRCLQIILSYPRLMARLPFIKARCAGCGVGFAMFTKDFSMDDFREINRLLTFHQNPAIVNENMLHNSLALNSIVELTINRCNSTINQAIFNGMRNLKVLVLQNCNFGISHDQRIPSNLDAVIVCGARSSTVFGMTDFLQENYLLEVVNRGDAWCLIFRNLNYVNNRVDLNTSISRVTDAYFGQIPINIKKQAIYLQPCPAGELRQVSAQDVEALEDALEAAGVRYTAYRPVDGIFVVQLFLSSDLQKLRDCVASLHNPALKIRPFDELQKFVHFFYVHQCPPAAFRKSLSVKYCIEEYCNRSLSSSLLLHMRQFGETIEAVFLLDLKTHHGIYRDFDLPSDYFGKTVQELGWWNENHT